MFFFSRIFWFYFRFEVQFLRTADLRTVDLRTLDYRVSKNVSSTHSVDGETNRGENVNSQGKYYISKFEHSTAV